MKHLSELHSEFAPHTDLFITAANVELKEVLSAPLVTDERLTRMAETLIQLMLAASGLRKERPLSFGQILGKLSVK